MIAQHHIHTLNTANKALQKAWERVLRARQGERPYRTPKRRYGVLSDAPACECDGGDGDNEQNEVKQ